MRDETQPPPQPGDHGFISIHPPPHVARGGDDIALSKWREVLLLLVIYSSFNNITTTTFLRGTLYSHHCHHNRLHNRVILVGFFLPCLINSAYQIIKHYQHPQPALP
jgi:hypothetical protein